LKKSVHSDIMLDLVIIWEEDLKEKYMNYIIIINIYLLDKLQ